ncbi:hypothetical protein [Fusobacterium sp. PH5-44]|uniref:hypothetical protein n=1 Tax=unclassified Fusobacterium TaxID=2648384 RepID=UPI003D21546F
MAQRINPELIDPMSMNSMNQMNGMAQRIQRIGKGSRKYPLNFDKNDKKFLEKFLVEVEKQFVNVESSAKRGAKEKINPLKDFFAYLKDFAKTKDAGQVMVSFEEYEFLKQMIKDSLKGMEKLDFKWYQFLKKATVSLMKKQYTQLYSRFK